MKEQLLNAIILAIETFIHNSKLHRIKHRIDTRQI